MVPKFVSPSDPAAQWTGALKGPADNYLIDVQFGVIVDVEASCAVRQAEVGAARTMLERTEQCFGLKPQWLAGDSAYGSAPMLNWLVEDKQITPRIQLVEASGRSNAGILVDTLHFDRSNSTLEELDRIPAERLPLVHVADAPAEKPTTTEGLIFTARAARLPPGEGGIDIAAIISHMPAAIPVALGYLDFVAMPSSLGRAIALATDQLLGLK